MATLRRFEFEEGAQRKFWEAQTEGANLRVRYGKTGTDGKTLDKALGSEAAAQRELARLVREKLGKGYREVGGTPAPVTAAAPKAAKPPKAKAATPPPPGTGTWRPRFEAMVAELRKNKKIEGVKAAFKPPASDAAVAKAEASLGRPIDADVVAFYREMNGFDLEWENLTDADAHGRVHLEPIEKVFGDWKGTIWFDDHEGGDTFKDLLPFDFFVPEACAAFDRSTSPLRVAYHYCGEEREDTGYRFTEYLERLLASRGYWYWMKTLFETDEDESPESENFLGNVGTLFRGVDKRLFRPKGEDLSALSLEELLARVAAAKEPSKSLSIALLAQGAPAVSVLEKMLQAPEAAARVRAIQVLTHLGMKALPLLPLILRAPLGLGAADATARDSVADAVSSLLGAANRLSYNSGQKFMTAGVKALKTETNIHPIALLLNSLSPDAVDPDGHFFAVALHALRGGDPFEVSQALDALWTIKQQGRAFERIVAESSTLEGEARAAFVRLLGSFWGLEGEQKEALRDLIRKFYEGPDEALQAAAVSGLWVLDEEGGLERYEPSLAHPSEKVRLAAVQEVAGSLKQYRSRGLASADELLSALARDPAQPPAVRSAAAEALQAAASGGASG